MVFRTSRSSPSHWEEIHSRVQKILRTHKADWDHHATLDLWGSSRELVRILITVLSFLVALLTSDWLTVGHLYVFRLRLLVLFPIFTILMYHVIFCLFVLAYLFVIHLYLRDFWLVVHSGALWSVDLLWVSSHRSFSRHFSHSLLVPSDCAKSLWSKSQIDWNAMVSCFLIFG